MAKRIFKWAGAVFAVLLLAAATLVVWLTATEYKPEPVESAAVREGGRKPLAVGDSLTVASWNTGYGGLGRDSDFFMDGGKDLAPTGEQELTNRNGIVQQLMAQGADVYFLQEVDSDSSRTGGIDQSDWYYTILSNSAAGPYSESYALNYSCDFVPYPLPPLGRVHSGVQTFSAFPMDNAQRVALPSPFSWPVSAANLKRCLLVSYVPLEGTDRELVLVNLHLEAYDDGEGKAAQTRMLMEVLSNEYEKGNYVIAGGDFNQTFPGALEAFPIQNEGLWTPGVLENGILPEGWRFACDLSVPSCRLLNHPYDPDPAGNQFYVIDGFILSPNVELNSVRTLDGQFAFSDHNPVSIQVTLAKR